MDQIVAIIKGFEIKFNTLPGVFSKNGVDFGSKLLIENAGVQDGTLIADLGCGSGVIGLTAAKLNPHGHVHMLDVNLRVVNLARENAQLNDLKNVEVFLSDLFSEVGDRTYHLILSNPSQHLGNDFLDQAVGECFKHLKPQGEVYWVVQKQLKTLVERLFEKSFANCTIVAHSNDYVVVKGRRNV